MDEQKNGTKEVGESIGKAGMAVKEGIVGSLKGINEIEAEIVSLVRTTVSNALRTIGVAAHEGITVAKDVMKGAIQATEEVGTGLTLSTKSVAKGIVMGVSDVGGDVVAVATTTVERAVKGAAEIGADVSVIARRAVDGVIEATREVGGNVEQVAKTSVEGAIEAAGSIGNTAVRAVTDVLVGIVGGSERGGLRRPAEGEAGGPPPLCRRRHNPGRARRWKPLPHPEPGQGGKGEFGWHQFGPYTLGSAGGQDSKLKDSIAARR